VATLLLFPALPVGALGVQDVVAGRMSGLLLILAAYLLTVPFQRKTRRHA
jgi:membrane-associated phospholipid phosphatase